MPPKTYARLWIAIAVVLVSVATGAALMRGRDPGNSETGQSGKRQTTATVTRQDFVRTVRLSGTVEAVESTTVAAPRLSGPNSQSLVITKLIKAGAPVEKGDLLVEFDRQTQLAAALDRRAELNDLDQQIKKKDAGERAARARDDGEILLAESSLSRAKLETSKNELLPRIQAEKNDLAVEQAIATLNQLKTTYALKRKAAEADVQILKIRRDRAENAMRQAETNAERMAVVAPISGMAVLRMVWKTNNQAEVQEGEEVRAGVPVVDVVNPKAMRVRARVSQADINDLAVGQAVKIGLDAYPELSFDGRIAQISPVGVVSTLSPKSRVFVVLIDVNGSHPNLMPDLTASLDVTLSRLPGALVVPRDAVGTDGKSTFVRVKNGALVQGATRHGRSDERTRRRADVRRQRRRRRRQKPRTAGRVREQAGRHAAGTTTMIARLLKRLRSRNSLLTIAVLVLAGGGLFATVGRGSVPDLPTADVTRGEFVDALELRGEIRPLRSVVLSSPMQSGELQILKLANNGSKVKAGDIVVQFDGTTLERTIQEKQSELKQANAEIEQANAQARITNEQNATALMKAKYDIERAKLDINRGDTVSRLENEKAKLALGDAEQRLKELEEKVRSDKTGAEADLSSKLRKKEKAIFDLKRAEDGLREAAAQGADRRRRQRAAELSFRKHDGSLARVSTGRPRLGRRRDPRAPRPLVGASPRAARRVGSQPPEGRAGRVRPNRGGSGQ